MINRLVEWIPNPLTLEQWGRVFRWAAWLRLAQTLVSVGYLVLAGGSGIAPGMYLYALILMPLKQSAEVLCLLAASDLTDYLGRRREDLRLGRRLGVLLWALAAVVCLMDIVPRMVAGHDLISIRSVVGLGVPLLYVGTGFVAFRFPRLLTEARQHALPAGGDVTYAVRRLAAGQGPLRNRFLMLCAVVGGVIVLRTASFDLSVYTVLYAILYPGGLLLAMAGWSCSLREVSRWPRVAAAFPLLLWIVPVNGLVPWAVMMVRHLGGPTVYLDFLGYLAKLIWWIAFVGAGFAVRSINRQLRLAREEALSSR